MKKLKITILFLIMAVSLLGCTGESDELVNSAENMIADNETQIIQVESNNYEGTIETENSTETLSEAPTDHTTETLTEIPNEIPTEVATMPSTEMPTELTESATEEEKDYKQVDEMVYAIQDVNIRSGPGTSYDKVDVLKEGQSVNRIGIGDDGWSIIIYKNQRCYVSSKYLEKEADKTEKNTYKQVDEDVYAIQDVNVRSGPGTTHDKVGALNEGEKVKRTGIGNDGWSKIIYRNKTCYVSSKYLTTTKPSEANDKKTDVEMVWIPQSGSKYHSKSNCSNMKNPSQITKEKAIARGYTACKKCH